MTALMGLEGIDGDVGVTITRIDLSMATNNLENDIQSWGIQVDPETGISHDPEVHHTKRYMFCEACKYNAAHDAWDIREDTQEIIYPTIHGLTPLHPRFFSKDSRGKAFWIVVQCPQCGCYMSALINYDEFRALRITGKLP